MDEGALQPPAPCADAALPDHVGRYPVLGTLGRGGMGVVYLARDPGLGREIAIKLLSTRLVRDAVALARFEREARLLASITHPNVAVVHSLEHDDAPFLTMEVVEGATLAERIAAGGMDVAAALDIARQIAAALEAAQARGILHGDLKPANVKITGEGQVKVLDFGLARTLGPDPEETLHVDATADLFCGTPGYMSPEQLRREAFDTRADVFAFGCVLFECLAGAPAFPGGSLAERLAATLDREPMWGQLPLTTPFRVRSLLRRCLDKAAQGRPGSFTLVRREIEEEIAAARVPREATPELPPDAVAGRFTGPGEVPRLLASFVGRREELEDLRDILADHRLVTVTGAGGCGKTRLALEFARLAGPDFPDGAWWVELAPLPAAEEVPAAVARALGVSERPGEALARTLRDALLSKRALLVLDDCERVVAGIAEFAGELLAAAPDLRILATSREPLGTVGERVYHLLPLALPSAAEADARNAESVQLFLERSRANALDFELDESTMPAVVEICRRLDGLPLALELAAARVRVLSVQEIALRLGDRFRFLGAGTRAAVPHHQTLRALVDWSYDHLSAPERLLLRRLSVFAGGWSLEIAERVCSGDGIEAFEILDLHSRLVDKSLVEMSARSRRRAGRTRYGMLETIREYGIARLEESGERARIEARHLQVYVELAEEAEPHLRGWGQTERFHLLTAEHDNLRVAVDRIERLGVDPEFGLRMVGALGRYWMIRGDWTEGRALCSRFLRESSESGPYRAKALNAAGNLAFHQGDYAESERLHTEARELRATLGDDFGVAMSWNNLGEVARMRGDAATAQRHYETCLAIYQRLGSDWGAAVAYNNLGELAQGLGQFATARRHHEQALVHWPRLGDRWGMAFSLANLGLVAAAGGDLEGARQSYERSLSISRELGDRAGTATALLELAKLASRTGDRPAALRQLGESLAIRVALGDRRGMVEALEMRAVLGCETDPGRCVVLLAAAAHARAELRAPRNPLDAEAVQSTLDGLRKGLGEVAFAVSWAEGERLTIEETAGLGGPMEVSTPDPT